MNYHVHLILLSPQMSRKMIGKGIFKKMHNNAFPPINLQTEQEKILGLGK